MPLIRVEIREGRSRVEKARLLDAIHAAGDPFVPVQVESYQEALFRVAAKIKVDPDYETEKVRCSPTCFDFVLASARWICRQISMLSRERGARRTAAPASFCRGGPD